METILITAKKTQCGYQPYFENQNNVSYTIGKDGWSFHSFMDCFWTGQYIRKLTIIPTPTLLALGKEKTPPFILTN